MIAALTVWTASYLQFEFHFYATSVITYALHGISEGANAEAF